MNTVNKELENSFEFEDLKFFGKITASITHELNNVLAIIDQSAGLLDDLIIGEKKGRKIPLEKLQSIAEKTTRHTQRGFEFIQNLNKFAHLVDEPIQDINLHEFISHYVFITKRFSALKEVELELDEAIYTTMISTNIFRLQQILFGCINIMLEGSKKGDRINLRCAPTLGGSSINISITNFPSEKLLKDPFMVFENLANQINWKIEILSCGTGIELILLPINIE